MPAVEAESNYAGWGNARLGSGRARSLTPRLHSVMNGASCAPATGQRPVSQLTEMNRVKPSRGETVRVDPSRACLRDHGTPRVALRLPPKSCALQEKEPRCTVNNLTNGRIEREKRITIHENGTRGIGEMWKAIVERSVARAREYRATATVGTPTTQAMTSRDASAATSTRSTTAFRAPCCIPGSAWTFLIPVLPVIEEATSTRNFYKMI
ncbi:hypothetical protein ALC60_09003 [Trachymyrmex zeteki]|uniref:Uncharacterized protein n=1 Tax=Mycetomoellerius zeteki TaxID=64791 RepID=A0A151WVU2_9HYME|nr:hypothetical protein ALC60_09003 [Trachymyrmex zeteki]